MSGKEWKKKLIGVLNGKEEYDAVREARRLHREDKRAFFERDEEFGGIGDAQSRIRLFESGDVAISAGQERKVGDPGQIHA